jgi:hypothetical protein
MGDRHHTKPDSARRGAYRSDSREGAADTDARSILATDTPPPDAGGPVTIQRGGARSSDGETPGTERARPQVSGTRENLQGESFSQKHSLVEDSQGPDSEETQQASDDEEDSRSTHTKEQHAGKLASDMGATKAAASAADPSPDPSEASGAASGAAPFNSQDAQR